jgi:hypothetical protein
MLMTRVGSIVKLTSETCWIWSDNRQLIDIVPVDQLAKAFWENPWLTLDDIGFPDAWSDAEIYAWQVKRALSLGPELEKLFNPRTTNPGGIELWAILVIRLVVEIDDLAPWLTNAALDQRPQDPTGWLAELRQTWVLCRLGA